MAGEYIEFDNNSQPAINDMNLNRLQQLIKQDIQGAVSGDTLPVGVIMPFGSDTIPENWLLCNGQAVSRTTYQDLFNTIGTTYGAGDGFTTFNLPDLKGKIPVGKDENDTDFDVLGETGGEKEHTLTIAEMPSHRHDIYTTKNNGTAGSDYTTNNYVNCGSNNNYGNITKTTSSIGSDNAHNNLQPYIVQNYIIKAFQSSGMVANVVQVESNSTTNAYSCSYINNKLGYDTSEKIIGTWTDGKPLYRKVISFGALPDNSTKSIAHNISNLKRIVKLEGFAGSSQNLDGITLPHATSNPIALYVDNTNVNVRTSSDATAYTETYIYVYYTKTTD